MTSTHPHLVIFDGALEIDTIAILLILVILFESEPCKNLSDFWGRSLDQIILVDSTKVLDMSLYTVYQLGNQSFPR